MILIPFCSPCTLHPAVFICQCNEWHWLCTNVELRLTPNFRSYYNITCSNVVLPKSFYDTLLHTPITRGYTLQCSHRLVTWQLAGCTLIGLDATYQIGDIAIVPRMEWISYGPFDRENSPVHDLAIAD